MMTDHHQDNHDSDDDSMGATEAAARSAGEQQFVFDENADPLSDDGDVAVPAARGGGVGSDGVGRLAALEWGDGEEEGDGEADGEEFFTEEEEEEDEYESEEEPSDGDGEGGEDGGLLTRAHVSGGIMSLLFGRNPNAAALLSAQQQALRGMPRLPLPLRPLEGDLAAGLNNATRGYDIGQAGPIWGCLDTSCDALALPTVTTIELQRQQRLQQQAGFKRVFSPPQEPCNGSSGGGGGDGDGSSSSKAARQQQQQSSGDGAAAAGEGASGGVSTRSSAARRRAAAGPGAAAAAAEPAGDDAATLPAADAAAGSASDPRMPQQQQQQQQQHRVINTACMLFKREVSLGRQEGFSRSQQAHLHCARAFPVFPQKVRDHMSSRCYIGQYSASGDFFIAAYQDRRVRLYDTNRNWALRKDVTTKMTRWTITDTTMSPDQRLLVYASISPVAFVVNVGSSYDQVDSQANITEVHEPLAFDGRYADGADARRRRGGGAGSDDDDDEWDDSSIGIWSIAWSPQGGQLIAGTNGNAVYVYDIEARRCLTKLTHHQDDVNAVAYLREGDPHLIVSGSDDSFVRVWDTRDRSGTLRAPQGLLVGHTEGITHMCPKGDGHHLISNCKDQTIKLWDTRKAVSHTQAAAAQRDRPRLPRWDYRWEDFPANGYAVQHPHDSSLMTYRGHAVLQTLIRAYFSPEHTTGQRYIYAGNAEGDILVWDVVTGKQVAKLQHNASLVRDCSWHPYEPELTSVSWDGRIISWGVQQPDRPVSSRRFYDD